jgi:hypothetical protein
MPSTNELNELVVIYSARSPGPGKGARPVLDRSQVLTVQPAEEGVSLKNRLGSQRAHQDGLAAQKVVHGARIQHPI